MQNKIAYFIIIIAMPAIVNAQSDVGFGGMAVGMMEPVNIVESFLNSTCLILGIAFIFACVVKFFEHRRSPLMVPISTVIFLLVAGIALLCLPFLAHFKE